MFQWLKHLPYKHEDLSLNLRTCLKSDVVACICDLIAATGKRETETGESSETPGPARASRTELHKIWTKKKKRDPTSNEVEGNQ